MRITILLIILFLWSCPNGITQTIISGGFVSGNWDSTGNPYLVEAPVSIHRDSVLHIHEGAEILFYDSAFLSVEGYINAAGTVSDSVIFTSAQNTWLGIRINQTDTAYQGNLIFRYCSFSKAHGSNVFEDGGALSVYNRDDVTIFNSSFYNNYAEEKGGAVYLESADIQLKRLSFCNNATSLVLDEGKGGALYAIDSEYIFEELDFIDNRSSIAGALYSNNTDLEFRNCNFLNNYSHAGGGALVCHKSGTLIADRCIFADNEANGSGGAIALLEAVDAYFRNCNISGNTSKSGLFLSDGGGVLVTPYDNEVDFVNCIISNNTADDYGGGMYITSNYTIIDCLFDSNQAGFHSEAGGGALLLAQAEGIILNTTFSGNLGENASSIFCEDTDLSLVNSIIWDDTITAEPKIYLHQFEDPTAIHVSYCDMEGGMGVIRGSGDYEINWGDGNFSSNPLFESLGVDFSLSNESPCIDTGRLDIYANMLPLLDLAVNPRVYRGKIDIGCYENQFPFGIPEFDQEHDFLLFPNPARDYYYIRNNSDSPFSGSCFISDISGRMIRSNDIYLRPGERFRESCSDLPVGLYLIRIESESYQGVCKLLIR